MRKISVEGNLVSKREYIAKDKKTGNEIGKRFQYSILSTGESQNGELPENAEVINVFNWEEDIKAKYNQPVILTGEMNGDYSNWVKITLIK